ncbi:MAG: metalloregulator ArsR/SmtB family transcription factor [Anaerolineales bacterium]|jgi:ArsR family transcriptional regulator|nr:metalloregulator ArsR/SmtB family transcription factor [Anaerolineales bacterium]
MNIPIQSSTLSDLQALRVAELFGALGDPSRVKIIAALLQGPMNVQALAEAAGISESAASHQLRSLRQMRLVAPRKEGRLVYYSLDDQHVVELFQRALDHILHN